MGAVTSTTRAHNISLEVGSRNDKTSIKGSNSCGRTRRSSVNRPVLKLQVEPATLEQVRHRLTSTSGPHLVTRNTLSSLARDSGIYDTLVTKPGTNACRKSDHAHHSRTYSTESHDSNSTVLLQIMEDEHEMNGQDMAEDDDDNYDHLIPDIDFGHLCDCTYGHISLLEEMEEKEGSKDKREDHMFNITFRHGDGRKPRGGQTFNQVLSPASLQFSTTDKVKPRIRHHKNLPSSSPSSTDSLSSSSASCDGHVQQIKTRLGMKKSNSASELMHHQIITEEELPVRRRKPLCQSEEDTSDWTLGESIMRVLSRKDLLIVNVENPQHQSEHEIIAAWPRLKDEFKKQKSQSLSDLTDISRFS